MSAFNAQRFGRVGLALGGDSAERAVSLRSGRAVAEALARLGVEFVELDGVRATVEAAAAGRIDRVFNVLHGRGGEDGCLQGALAAYGIPLTGSGLLASALSMDKLQTKRIWRACGLPTPDWQVAESDRDAARIAATLQPPLFVKPAREGSSVGMGRVDAPEQLEAALANALKHDQRALVERLVDGPEYTASLLHDDVLPLIRIETPRDFYDYDAKYASNDTQYHCPCGLAADEEAALAALAREAFRVLGCSGWGRVDFLLDRDGRPWLLEANTVPGMTDHSLVPMAAQAAGLDFDALVGRILETAVGGEAAR
ncbi:D-alanine--D-alanine ligase [Wenzhouxiangella sp. XN79A]|uniref:D-alanine--D-alanine ligase n=1 Tax=Wenzhouxiangella sp. XN79A TaxID=2724193 RepID=UPI00144A9078|nr:D-alanine--D-alanine ligase [Wenzhouxiangella sp. XN79A]NKI34326.1 D-alanine--D-alanine ligase [Wenzhouxiangella sp. XN79A]